AFIGPGTANLTKNFISEQLYVGSYLSLAVFMFLPAIFFLFYENKTIVKNDTSFIGRGYFEIISQPRFLQ